MDVSGRSGEMEVFIAVAEQGSLSAAARQLDLTPSAISRIIARIETRLGARLLVRTTRHISLTVEGETYLRAARRILADIAEVEDAITDQGVPRGRIRVSASLTHGRIAIVPLLGEFCARYPKVVVDLSLTDHVVDILGGQADIAVRFGALADSPLSARKLGETGHVIVAAPDYLARHGTPRTPEDLFAHNCLGFNFRRAEAGWPFRHEGRDFRLRVTGSIVANSGEALTHLARHGVGIAREGAFAVQDDLASGKLVALLEAFNPQDRDAFHAVFVGGPTMPARVRVFVDFLVEKFGAGPLA
ncbi:LysR family transcriptional regulator [Amantichitinum ursilacus]|uniref:HTH-type transcriptional regulator DmlR n=1 Tax=Amantichitinum ursilacus TaxID=857265 RepID=A0A0N0XI32_9NEIS|nr:LysR family transcriptional regulator [Amantichitinum ursilacus]KPC49653.1 HTH-type transcriptional regulator DmlR [Amantichitinum ursilacus]